MEQGGVARLHREGAERETARLLQEAERMAAEVCPEASSLLVLVLLLFVLMLL